MRIFKPLQQKSDTDKALNPKEKWKRLIWYAKKQWYELGEAELFSTEGDEIKLAALISERYAIKQDEAHRRVKSFFIECANK